MIFLGSNIGVTKIDKKRLTLGSLLLEIGKLVKEYEDEISVEKPNEETFYSINEIIDLYPMLSKHILTNAINNSELKVTWIGNKRYFSLNDIDYYLSQKQDKVVNDIPEQIEKWRNKK